MSQPNTESVSKTEQLYAIRYYPEGSPRYGILKVYRPNGGLLSCVTWDRIVYLAEHFDVIRNNIFNQIHILDDVPVTDTKFNKLLDMAKRMHEEAFVDVASDFTAALVGDENK